MRHKRGAHSILVYLTSLSVLQITNNRRERDSIESFSRCLSVDSVSEKGETIRLLQSSLAGLLNSKGHYYGVMAGEGGDGPGHLRDAGRGGLHRAPHQTAAQQALHHHRGRCKHLFHYLYHFNPHRSLLKAQLQNPAVRRGRLC